jgi:hypothetical protein
MKTFMEWMNENYPYGLDPENVLDDEELKKLGYGSDIIKASNISTGGDGIPSTIKMKKHPIRFAGQTNMISKNKPLPTANRTNPVWADKR